MNTLDRVSPATQDVDRFDYVLAQWVDLHQAILARPRRIFGPKACTPWNCNNRRVRDAWHVLTDPNNLDALETLHRSLSDQHQAKLALRAVWASRKRNYELRKSA